MIDFSEISDDGENWELFARDFLEQEGYKIISSPDRGPDGGKDLIIKETYKGIDEESEFTWLVSCKHYAKSNKSVQESDEINIQERVNSFNADGFLGFYSTIPSSGLNSRLRNLKDTGNLKKFKIFDKANIESKLLAFGYSKLLIKYLPQQYKILYPPRDILGKYEPLNCAYCGKDLLTTSYEDPRKSIIVFIRNTEDPNKNIFTDVYWCCKGNCDRQLRKLKEDDNHRTGWDDIDDLMIPIYFLHWLFGVMNLLWNNDDKFTEEALSQIKKFIYILSQRVFRDMNEEERERANRLINLGYL